MDYLSSIKTASQLHSALNQKEANIPGVDLEAVQQTIESLRGDQIAGLKSDVMSNFAKLLLLGGGVGAGARGLYGLSNMFNKAPDPEEEDDGLVYGTPKIAATEKQSEPRDYESPAPDNPTLDMHGKPVDFRDFPVQPGDKPIGMLSNPISFSDFYAPWLGVTDYLNRQNGRGLTGPNDGKPLPIDAVTVCRILIGVNQNPERSRLCLARSSGHFGPA